MRFADPQALWALLLLPLMLWLLLWAAGRRRRALHGFVGDLVRERLTRSLNPGRRRWRHVLFLVGIGWLVLAMAGPQFGVRLSMVQRRGIDVVICLDLSRSMLAQDIRPNRLDHARHAIGELLGRLQGDRVGLVVYAAHAFVQCPLTLDTGALRLLLRSVVAGDLPSQGTSTEKALEVATTNFDADDQQHKVIILFSDGEDHVGDAVSVAARLARQGVRIFTVGVGTEAGELIPDDRGQGHDYHKDRAGNYVKTRLDEASLRDIARAGEGSYFRSSLGGSELTALQDRLDHLEDKDLGEERFSQHQERYQWPLGLALVCLLAEVALSDRQAQQRQWRGRFV